MIKISVILGTRPEAIKLAPLIRALKESLKFEVEVCSTGQHKEMLNQVLTLFNIVPDRELSLMRPNQGLAQLNALALEHVDDYLKKQKPALVIVQGDTTTVLAATLAAFYNKVDVAHVEAGLRTYDFYSPYPEEMNRVLTSKLASLHFAPTKSSTDNLIRDGVPHEQIFLTGNTVIDSLLFIQEGLTTGKFNYPAWIAELNEKKTILITGHRRESFGKGIEDICKAILTLAKRYPDFIFVYPVHLNPNVTDPVNQLLGNVDNIKLTQPLDYLSFVALMVKSYIILTDSGGIQEEAPSLGKPVLVMRENSERPEAIAIGAAKLVGTSVEEIVSNMAELIENPEAYARMSQVVNPYGDGTASIQILKVLTEKYL